MKRKYLYLMLFLLISISIGYALLSSSLNINGLGHLKKSTWNVYFDNVEILSGENLATTKPVVTNHMTTDIEFSVNFDVPGDVFSFSVDVVNNGTIDAMISLVNNTMLTDEQKKYADYSITYLDGTPILEKNYLESYSSDSFLVTISYKDDIEVSDLPNNAQSIDFNLSLEYVQAKDSDKKINKSNIVRDLSGNNNNAIIYGAKINDDGTVTTDGVDDYIDCGLAGYDFGNSISYVVRVKLYDLNKFNYIIGNWHSAGGGGIFYKNVTHEGTLGGEIYSSYNVWYTLPNAFTFETNKYYIVVMTYNGSKTKIFVNGQLVKVGDAAGNIAVSDFPIYIGSQKVPNYTRSANATFTDALVFDRVLSDEEVARDYGVEVNPTDTTDMLFYYRFEK